MFNLFCQCRGWLAWGAKPKALAWRLLDYSPLSCHAFSTRSSSLLCIFCCRILVGHCDGLRKGVAPVSCRCCKVVPFFLAYHLDFQGTQSLSVEGDQFYCPDLRHTSSASLLPERKKGSPVCLCARESPPLCRPLGTIGGLGLPGARTASCCEGSLTCCHSIFIGLRGLHHVNKCLQHPDTAPAARQLKETTAVYAHCSIRSLFYSCEHCSQVLANMRTPAAKLLHSARQPRSV